LAMREVKFAPRDTVPGLAVVVAYLLVFASIVLLVMYVHHIGQALRVSALIELVGSDTRKLLDRVYPSKGSEPEVDRTVICAPNSGVVVRIAYKKLIDLATRECCRLEVVPAIGQFVPAGSPLIHVHGTREFHDAEAAAAAIDIELERTLEDDPAYGFRLLVDIAER